MRNLLIFDFDGTLIDTITDVGLCFNQALKQCDFPQHPLEKFSDFAGGNLETVVSKMLPQDRVTEENIAAVKTRYREIYLKSEKKNTKPYPGIMDMLFVLKKQGYFLAVNSNKGQQLLDDMVGKMFEPDFFDAVVGYSEDRPSKPDAYGVEMICRECNCKLGQAIYVGDGKSDVMTAANAGIPCIYVQWGQGKVSEWRDKYEAKIVNTVEELRQILIGGENIG